MDLSSATSGKRWAYRTGGGLLCVLAGIVLWTYHASKTRKSIPELMPIQVRVEGTTALRNVFIQTKQARGPNPGDGMIPTLVIRASLPKPLLENPPARVSELQKASGQVLFFPNILQNVGAVRYEVRAGPDLGFFTFPRPRVVTIPKQFLARFAGVSTATAAPAPRIVIEKDSRTGRPKDISAKKIAELSTLLHCGARSSNKAQQDACQALGAFKRGRAIGGVLKPSQTYLGEVSLVNVNAKNVVVISYYDVLFVGGSLSAVSFFPFKPQTPAQEHEAQAIINARKTRQKLPKRGALSASLDSAARGNVQPFAKTNGSSTFLLFQQHLGVYFRASENHLVVISCELASQSNSAPRSYFLGTLY
jgi:hypothetical protein